MPSELLSTREPRDERTDFARRAILACAPCANCPSCQCVAVKRACGVGQITSIFSPIPPPQEGRIAIVTDVGSGMRWTRRFTRRVGLSADGKDVWSWRPDADAKVVERSANDGGKRARSPGRARYKPLKPSRRECRLIAVCPWLLTRVLSTLAHAAMGAARTRHSLRPLVFEGDLRNSSGRSCRGNADAHPSIVMPRFKRGIQYAVTSRVGTAVSGILGRPVKYTGVHP